MSQTFKRSEFYRFKDRFGLGQVLSFKDLYKIVFSFCSCHKTVILRKNLFERLALHKVLFNLSKS
ncbi:hypothetical protein LEP1GSC166_4009 [Leptospira kirschneri]|nr:hypothetical protein LEP1GSC166_4009 [Leptospira kirschneri]